MRTLLSPATDIGTVSDGRSWRIDNDTQQTQTHDRSRTRETGSARLAGCCVSREGLTPISSGSLRTLAEIVITPPAVPRPLESGDTSSNSKSRTCPTVLKLQPLFYYSWDHNEEGGYTYIYIHVGI